MILKEGSSGEAVRRLQECLKDREGFDLTADGEYGLYTTAAVRAFQLRNKLQPDGIAGPATLATLGLDKEEAQELPAEPASIEPGGVSVSTALLVKIAPGLKKVLAAKTQAIADALNSVLLSWRAPTGKIFDININSPLRLAHFLAQLAHESDGFKTMEEYASGAAYEGRADLGNIHPGDGVEYKGRGWIELTGEANYLRFFKETGVDIWDDPKDSHDNDDPKKAATPEVSAQTAVWYWQAHNLNALADKDDVRGITKKINGGYNGLDSRKAYLSRAKEALGIS